MLSMLALAYLLVDERPMRKFLFLEFLVFFSVLSQELKAQIQVEFEKSFHDFGYVKLGDPTKCTFKFTNIGSTTLVPSQCGTTCGCDVASCSKDPIAPGESGKIEYLYDHRRLGNIYKSVTIRFAGIDSVFCLKVCGYIYDSANFVPESQKHSYQCGCNASNHSLAPILLLPNVEATPMVHELSAIDETTKLSSNVFPNPLSSQSVITFSEHLEEISITLFNATGSTVKQQLLMTGRIFPIDRDNLSAGIYFIQVAQEDRIIASHRVLLTSE
jgi:Protein of unknown function (DUF1573)/Secretion system C-terminal sorting domain